MKIKEVIEYFIQGLPAHTTNLYSTGDKLYSYNTCIIQNIDGYYLINMSRYSVTTTKHRNMFIRMYMNGKCRTKNNSIVYPDNVKYLKESIPRNTNSLIERIDF